MLDFIPTDFHGERWNTRASDKQLEAYQNVVVEVKRLCLDLDIIPYLDNGDPHPFPIMVHGELNKLNNKDN